MKINLRKVTKEDEALLFKWVNDPVVRANSFNNERIAYEEHSKWFKEKINANNCYIYICQINAKPIGQVRIDITEKDIGIINYSIDKEHRGKGYGTEVLRKIKEKLREDNVQINKLVGRVKYENISSRRAFVKAGYKYIERDDYVEYYINF